MEKRIVVHLAYLDDSDTKSKSHKWQVMAGVLIPDTAFILLEMAMGAAASTLLPEEQLAEFEEFHACELYGGYGVFDGIEQGQRFEAIKRLLSVLEAGTGFPVVYGAVSIDKLKTMVYASADPLDMSFRMCAEGIQTWIAERIWEKAGIPTPTNPKPDPAKIVTDKPPIRLLIEELVMLIADDCDKKVKDSLYKSFRALRPRLPGPEGQRPDARRRAVPFS